jgi:hypothetical protein
MMEKVHFDFVLNAEDAQNLFDCINRAIQNAQTDRIELILGNQGQETQESLWFLEHSKYLLGLKSKIHNKPYEEKVMKSVGKKKMMGV